MRKVMIIGTDAATVQEIAREIGRDYLVLQSSRGEKAIPLLSLFEPDAIVLVRTSGQPDFPRMTRLIRSQRAGRTTPLILLANKGSAFLELTGPNLHPVPTLSIPVLRAILRGTLQPSPAAAGL
jgi:DNA-binding response OmpR family regulator